MSPELKLVEDFSKDDIRFDAYVKLKSLNVGDVIFLRDSALTDKVLVIGAATPYEGVTGMSCNGWDYARCANFKVTKVYKINCEHVLITDTME